ncbi:MAG TPA: glycosyltransferase family 2 protein [Chitinophagaceae bacterium]|nr:glycosyltransferase family 2 protein [Chitinophagaceae bacterium]
MNFPKISIVIPSYNQGQFLEETILSVIDQQYPNLELFVVDGGSTDNSVDVIKKHEQHLTWWVSEKDNGQSEAINKGLKNTKGEIVCWVNSDDLLMPGSLQVISSAFISAPMQVGLIHGGSIVFNADKIKETRLTYQSPNKEAYLSGMVFPQPAAFFRKSLVDRVGYLNEQLHYGMDYDLFLRLALVCDFLPIDNVLAKYRLHQQSKSVSESNRFIGDWKRSFVNLCKNLQWSNELEYLRKTHLFNDELNYFKSFSFEPLNQIQIAINKRKALFFHLGHILKDLYWNYHVRQAKRLKNMMKEDFENTWWQEDPRLNTVASKLNYPDFALAFVRFFRLLKTKR